MKVGNLEIKEGNYENVNVIYVEMLMHIVNNLDRIAKCLEMKNESN